MGYLKADEVLPNNIIEIIQTYVDGQSIYIPKKSNERADWGSKTTIRQELTLRNKSIFRDYQNGVKVCDLADKYFLSEKSIQRIIRKMK